MTECLGFLYADHQIERNKGKKIIHIKSFKHFGLPVVQGNSIFGKPMFPLFLRLPEKKVLDPNGSYINTSLAKVINIVCQLFWNSDCGCCLWNQKIHYTKGWFFREKYGIFSKFFKPLHKLMLVVDALQTNKRQHSFDITDI